MKSLVILASAIALPLVVACSGSSPNSVGSSGAAVSGADACEEARDCSGFLPQSAEMCSDGTSENAAWECKAKECVISYCKRHGGVATETTTPAGSTACAAASDCTGLLPRNTESCADGTSQGAAWDCNAGTCAISYCDNNGGVGSPTGNGGCQSASDCTGLLPRSVESCADGTSQGASWECNAGTCAINYCDNNGGVATSGNGGCQSASDCTGLLPRSTEQCADGTSQGAQWDCNAGTCAISYCDNHGGTQS